MVIHACMHACTLLNISLDYKNSNKAVLMMKYNDST